ARRRRFPLLAHRPPATTGGGGHIMIIPLSARLDRTQMLPVIEALRPNDASALGAEMKAWIVDWREIRSLVPSMFTVGVGVVPMGRNVDWSASRKSPLMLIVLGLAPATEIVALRDVESEQKVKVPAGDRMSVPPPRTRTFPYVPGGSVTTANGWISWLAPPVQSMGGIGQNGFVSGRIGVPFVPRTWAPGPRCSVFANTLNTFASESRFTVSPATV